MEHSSHKNLRKTSLMPEGNIEHKNGLTPKRTPTDSHQPPILTFIIYLNIMRPHLPALSIVLNRLKVHAQLRQAVEGGDFFTRRLCEPLPLSIPHARNFVLCLSIYN